MNAGLENETLSCGQALRGPALAAAFKGCLAIEIQVMVEDFRRLQFRQTGLSTGQVGHSIGQAGLLPDRQAYLKIFSSPDCQNGL